VSSLSLVSVVPFQQKSTERTDALQGILLEVQALLEAGELEGLVIVGEVKQGDRQFMHHWQVMGDRYRVVGCMERAKQIALSDLDDEENDAE
jgi:hypothetical protein